MAKWEYLIQVAGVDGDGHWAGAQRWLNAMGSQGWELTSVAPHAAGEDRRACWSSDAAVRPPGAKGEATNSVIFTLKRPCDQG